MPRASSRPPRPPRIAADHQPNHDFKTLTETPRTLAEADPASELAKHQSCRRGTRTQPGETEVESIRANGDPRHRESKADPRDLAADLTAAFHALPTAVTTRRNAMTESKPKTSARQSAYARTFEDIEAYEQWLEENTDEPTLNDETPEQRFQQLGEVSDAAGRLNPYPDTHFVASFESFEEYEAWKNDEEGVGNQRQMD